MVRILIRLGVGLLGLATCFQLIALAGAAGVSRFLSANSVIYSSLEPADVAVKLAPSDPEAHYSKALALTNLNRLNEAKGEFERAIQLRPYYYYQWLDLGVTLDRLGDSNGAIVAIRESIRLAPVFSQPHWQLGNLLFRQGQYDDAFAELRKGSESNASLVASMFDLAWAAANGDVPRVDEFIQPRTTNGHLELARYLARQGKGEDAARHVSEAGPARDEQGRAFLHETILFLLASKQYGAAYRAWVPGHKAVDAGRVVNGNFADPISQDDPGFGWQVVPQKNSGVAIDPAGPNGARSLSLQFSGENAPSEQFLYQLILPRPNARYSLKFTAKSQDLVTGGPPIVIVLDVSGESPKILGQSAALTDGNRNWTPYQIDFSTEAATSAIRVGLQRMNCAQTPCPIFGRLWLSQFALVAQ